MPVIETRRRSVDCPRALLGLLQYAAGLMHADVVNSLFFSLIPGNLRAICSWPMRGAGEPTSPGTNSLKNGCSAFQQCTSAPMSRELPQLKRTVWAAT